jgi:hypothetical protein
MRHGLRKPACAFCASDEPCLLRDSQETFRDPLAGTGKTEYFPYSLLCLKSFGCDS